MQRLRFLIQGSSPEPYSLTAEGVGASFRIYCSCPAGRRGGFFCKHAAALLVGDVTNLIEPSARIADLAAMASGSELASRALAYAPRPAPDPGRVKRRALPDLRDLCSRFIERCSAAGLSLEADKNGVVARGLTPSGRASQKIVAGIRRKTSGEDIKYTVYGLDNGPTDFEAFDAAIIQAMIVLDKR